MRWSKLFIPTLREAPAGAASASHKLLMRAGYVREGAYLYLGHRSMRKIIGIVREEIERIGGQELYLPTPLLPVGELRSYKQLPQIWYQIEPRVCESYSFDVDDTGLETSYRKHHEAFCRIFERCGLKYRETEGGFAVMLEAGEDLVAECVACGYAAKLEKAVSKLAHGDGGGTPALPEPFHTPGKKTIDDVSAFDGRPPDDHIKALVYITQGKPVMILLPGNHELSEAKLAPILNDAKARAAQPDEVRAHTGAFPGSVGPVGFRYRILADASLQGRQNMIAGANRDDYHLTNVAPDRDFHAEFHDVRTVQAGDACTRCGAALKISRAIEVAHMTKRGGIDARVLQASGQEAPLLVGSYGIGIQRILTAAIEQSHDADGIALPPSIAPFQIVITIVNSTDKAMVAAAEELYQGCLDAKLDILLDDRDERPGVKFKDADLIGVPFRVNAGRKVSGGLVEVVQRSPRTTTDVRIFEAPVLLRKLLTEGLAHAQS